MARYREKSPEDMAWNRARRKITRELDTQIMDIREELLNTALTGAWQQFTEALERGNKLELEGDIKQFVGDIIRKELTLEIVGVDASVD